MPDDLTQEWLTVAQASAYLGISERTLRRILRQPEIAAKTQAKQRHTLTGLRRSTLLPLELIEQLPYLFPEAKLGRLHLVRNTGKYTGNIQAQDDVRVAEQKVIYEKLLAEKEKRITELTAALEHERERSRYSAVNQDGKHKHTLWHRLFRSNSNK